jgi:NADPH-dependent 2,4-dienoyl-CoA reductase/sulfur reductase-like enzyme/pSer/pThr/pTyr-binding forkhead associated (FHA) protein/CRP-like cAMP-binding protein/Fe-S-cluster-containing hydrogenase component 2
MGQQQSYVIIGNGIAGVTAAEILRAEVALCSITIVADDLLPVSYRPALKDFLGGHLPEAKLWARPATFYQDQRIRFVPGRVFGINTMQRFVQLHDGKRINFDKLLLANGARPRHLSCPGLNLAGVSTLRSVADYKEIQRRLSHVNRVVICGSGTLALESAETLRHRGYEVTHLLRGATLWSEVLDPVASDMVLQEERRDGIDVHCGEEVAEIVGKHGQVAQVITTGGERIACEMVLIAIGIEPLTDFIRASGVACGRGVKVDNGMCTNVSNIYAAGDVVEITDESTGRTRVPGQWFPAVQQAQVAAYNMLGLLAPGHPFYPGPTSVARYAYTNYYNATFLYGLDFVGLGLTTRPPAGYQEIIADPQPRSYRKVMLKNGSIVGALLLGDRTQALAFKRAIDHRVNLAPVADQLFTADFNLDTWLDQHNIPGAILNVDKEGSGGYLNGNDRLVDTPALSSAEYTRNFRAKDVDAFLVPIPHPKVPFAVAELQLHQSSQPTVMTIGRQAGVTFQLEHSSVSRIHAEVTCADGAYVLRDKGSANGTFFNGVPLTRASAYQLSHHDQVRFGDAQFRFELRQRLPSGSPLVSSATRSGFLPVLGTNPGRQRRYHVYLRSGGLQGEGDGLHDGVSRTIPTDVLRTLGDTPALVLAGQNTQPRVVHLAYDRRYTLGRDSRNDIVLDDTSSSRSHAEIFAAPDGFYVRDLDSRYGVFVNKAKVNNAYHLSHGDRIVLGNMLLYFSCAQSNAPKAKDATVTNQLSIQMPQAGESDETAHHAAWGGDATNRVPTVSRDTIKRVPTMVGLEHRRQVQLLGEQQVKFEIAMCIGCDRCMDACPLPLSSRVSIADLNSATVTERVAPHIASFTHECIMCGSCVPVCPVDNHRDLLMLSLKERLGVSWNSQPDMRRVTQALPHGWTVPMVISRLREQPILRDSQQAPDTYLLHMIAASKPVMLAPGEMLLREGEYGRDLYLILEGHLELSATAADNAELIVAILGRGEYTGDDGLLTGMPYKASARAQLPTLVLQVPEQVMQRLMEIVPSVRNYFENFNMTRSLKSILNRMALFQGVSDGDIIHFLVQQTPVKQYERGERLFAEDKQSGRPSRETLHILLEGFVKVARHSAAGNGQQKGAERIIAYRQGGDYFAGGLDLLGDGQAVTVTTINRCRVAEVPRHVLLALFQGYPEVNQRFAARVHEYLETVVSTQGYALATGPLQHVAPAGRLADLNVQAGLHSLVNDGVVEGTEVLVIDLDKCIHCDECEEACARRHGHSRMNRKGMVVGNISIATACRQCQDPVCMLCSRAGIARHPNGEVYITESCIGCGICAERCPYGAISIVSIDDEMTARSSWQRFSSIFTKDAGKTRARKSLPVVSAVTAGGSYAAPGPLDMAQAANGYDALRKKVAIKCDLCAGYADQACVQACPTGAALRIQPTTFFGTTEEILRRRAN